MLTTITRRKQALWQPFHGKRECILFYYTPMLLNMFFLSMHASAGSTELTWVTSLKLRTSYLNSSRSRKGINLEFNCGTTVHSEQYIPPTPLVSFFSKSTLIEQFQNPASLKPTQVGPLAPWHLGAGSAANLCAGSGLRSSTGWLGRSLGAAPRTVQCCIASLSLTANFICKSK